LLRDEGEEHSPYEDLTLYQYYQSPDNIEETLLSRGSSVTFCFKTEVSLDTKLFTHALTPVDFRGTSIKNNWG